MRTTRMTISGKVLYQNAKALREAVPAKVRMLCVVKADAYGHNSVEAAKLMKKAGAGAFAVAIVEEAERLRTAGIDDMIVILGGAGEESLRQAVRADASQAVYTADALRVLQDEAVKTGKRAKAHLKIDSGMSRLGVRTDEELSQLLKVWKTECPDVEMEGIFTHFCVADTEPEFTEKQNAAFAKALAAVRKEGFTPIAHAAATSAMLNERYQYDMVRAGIALYGSCMPALSDKLGFAQTISCKPLRIETIAAGDTVGYGRTYTASRETRVMTIPIGYGDGYPRHLSNRGSMLVCGKRAPIIGRVCMDMTMIDVTDIPEADINSEVVIMGTQGKEKITPDEMADLIGTIPYEIMLGFLPRVTRVFEDMPE